MRIDVTFGPPAGPAALVAGRVVAVIDVLRASSTIAAALANGARHVVPLESADDAVSRARQFERADVRLAGERRMLPIPGFDLGNSPREMTRDAVEGRTVLFTTTNGTAALLAVQGARDVLVASFVNFTPALEYLRAALREEADLTFVCAGRDRQFALEDAACAGRYVAALADGAGGVAMGDAAVACRALHDRFGASIPGLFEACEHGQALAAAGLGEDLAVCADLDAYPVVPLFQDRQIALQPAPRER